MISFFPEQENFDKATELSQNFLSSWHRKMVAAMISVNYKRPICAFL